jgi:uncharacterized protein YcfJ
MKTKIAKYAIAASVAGALLVPASQAAAGTKTENAILGAVLGGVAGAALSHGDGGAAAIGAVAGAAIGASTGHSSHHYVSRHRYPTRSYSYDRRDRYQNPYRYDSRHRTSYYGQDYYGRGYYDQYGYHHRY